MLLKGCRRCGGDMCLETDLVFRVDDLVCIQCGYLQAFQPVAVGRPVIEATTHQETGERRRSQRRERRKSPTRRR